jgi:hypothetical protein
METREKRVMHRFRFILAFAQIAATAMLAGAETRLTVATVNNAAYALPPSKMLFGNYLRSLGFNPLKLGSTGRGFRMTLQLARQVHKLATDLGIKRADTVNYQAIDHGYAGKSCSLCDEFGLLVQEDGTKLRTEDPFQGTPEGGSARRAAQKVAGTIPVPDLAPRKGWRGHGGRVGTLAEQKRARELLAQSRDLLKQMQAD